MTRRSEHLAYQRAYGPGPELIRTVRFAPFRKGQGATFTLTVYDTHRTEGGAFGRSYLAYKLTRRAGGKSEVLFEGDDYSPSPMQSTDGDASILGLMAFLTIQPGDTDEEYFDKYTPRQLEWASSYEAEALGNEVSTREERLERRR